MSEMKNDNYLIELLDNLEHLKNKNLSVSYKIIDIKKSGFTIKTNGLFAFISFEYMPWHYKSLDYWKAVFPFLTEKWFKGTINFFNREPIKVIIDGKGIDFPKCELENEIPYKAIILQKTDYGLILELGSHFNWKYGSIIGLAHKSTFIDVSNYEIASVGEQFTTFFHGYTKHGKPILGEVVHNLLILNGGIDDYVGTTKSVWVKVNEINYLFNNEKRIKKQIEYLVEDRYPASLSITKNIYPGIKKEVREIVNNFKHNEVIQFEIIGITKFKKLKLTLTKEYLEQFIKQGDK